MLLRPTLLLANSDRSFNVAGDIFCSVLSFPQPFVSNLAPSLCPLPPLAMDPSQQTFHYHIARALMHLNQLAAFLPSFEATSDWDPGSSIPRPIPHHHGIHASRNLHRFVPLPTDTRPPPSMTSHGDLPPHFVSNPESHFHPTFHRDLHPAPHHSNRGNSYEEIHMVEDLPHPHVSAHPAPRAKQASRSTAPRSITPAEEPAPARSSKRPGQSLWLNTSTGMALLPVTEALKILHRHTPFHMALPALLHHISTLNPTTLNRTGNELHHLLPPSRDTSFPLILLPVPASTHSNPNPLDPAIVDHRNRPWPPADDKTLIRWKMDSKSRPAWKTIASRMNRTTESCQARWQWLKNTNSSLLNPDLPDENHAADD